MKGWFHAWRSSHFNKKAETVDSFVTSIRQVGALLGYGECHIVEVFKNTVLSRHFCILFPIKDLRQAVVMAKIFLQKRKYIGNLLDRPLSFHFISTNTILVLVKRM